MGKIHNPWLTPLQRGYNQIKAKLISGVKKLQDEGGNPLITDYSEGNIFVIITSMFSAIAEVLHYYIDNVARETFFVTARKYSSLVKHAALLDYHPKSATAARVEVVLTRPLTGSIVSSNITIPSGLLINDSFGNTWEIEKSSVWYSNTTTCKIYLIQHELYRVNSLNGNFIPNTSGQVILELPIPSSGFYEHGSLRLSIDGQQWHLVETLAHSKPSDRHYMVYVTETGAVKIAFGDGRFGYKPLTDSTITHCSFYLTKGSKGNIPDGSITQVAQSIQNQVGTLTCTNPLPGSGGSDYEDFFKLKTSVPLSVKTLGVAITKEDYKNLAMLIPGVGKAAVEYECGRKINIYISPVNGGIATQTLCDTVKEFIANRSPLTTRIKVNPVGIVSIKLDLNVTGKKSCSKGSIESSIIQALLDAYSPNAVEIDSNVRISDIYSLIDNLPVVDHLYINKFYIKPWPITVYGNTQLIIGNFDIISSGPKDSMKYIVVFINKTQYTIRSIYNGFSSSTLTTGVSYTLNDDKNGFSFSISITDSDYRDGFRYTFVIAKPNYDYTEPGFNMPVFTDPATQLSLHITEVL